MPHGFTGFINDEENGLRFKDLRIETGIYMQLPRLIALRKWILDFFPNLMSFHQDILAMVIHILVSRISF